MSRENLILEWKVVGESTPRVRRANRIQIDGAGVLKIWKTRTGAPESIRISELEAISIRQAKHVRKAA